ncbi:hypothetical protein CEP51_004009 [Fusarium floridanum]|uniref:Uncharacterized protein n=1 Tax=Fusarium floridanum TaxID=1325733 RepID=A0A428S3B6_9HYPO|nr:hypothetical protein CEP51_004009 [Fusarium floridanum]
MSNFLMLSQAPAAMERREPSTNSGILGGGGSSIETEPCQSTSGNMPTPSRALQTRYLELVFGSDVTLGGNPGLHAYFRHMEDSFEPLLEASFAPVWDAFGLPRPRSTHDCWPLPVAVLEAIQRQTREPQDVSIDVIIEAMLSACGSPVLSNRSFCQVAVFAVLCWSTMILTPGLQPQAPQPQLVCHLSRRFESDKLVQQTLDRCRRSIPATFRGFKAQAWGRDVMQVAQHESRRSEDLHKSVLNYRSLQMFGKIRIQWVTSMAAHLEFDPASRHLSVFRFPTVCALRSMQDRNSQRTVLRSICEEFDPLPAEDIVHRYTTLEQEILLSYRLLFAQSSASRKRIGAELNKLRRDGQLVDDFLSTLFDPERALANKREIEVSYSQEIEKLLHENFPEYSRIEMMNVVVRKRDPRYPAPGNSIEVSHEQPAGIPHTDFSVNGLPLQTELSFPGQWIHLKDMDFDILNLWRPLYGPNDDWPLAVCDYTSVEDGDIILNDDLHRDRAVENCLLHPNAAHRWHYIAGQTPEDVLVFRTVDSRGKRARGFHCAVENPLSPPGQLRSSIEIRVVAIR